MELITRAELARLAGVSKPSITEAVRKSLKGACVGKGRALRIDATHPVIVEYIRRAREEEKPGPKLNGDNGPEKPKRSAPATTEISDSDEIIDFESLTVREVCLRFGSASQFKDHMKALKDIAEYKLKEQKLRQERGELIERDTLAANLVYLVDSAFKRLVGEMPRSVSMQIVPLILSGGEGAVKEVEKKLSEAAGKILKDCKKEVMKKLKTTAGGAGNGRYEQ